LNRFPPENVSPGLAFPGNGSPYRELPENCDEPAKGSTYCDDSDGAATFGVDVLGPI
jgi:hypothetical protein